MKRDMDLVRLILLKIEEEYVSTAILDLKVDNYDTETVAFHCQLLNEAGYIKSYKPIYGGNKLCFFNVGALTWDGYEFLDKIRDDSTWGKTKKVIKEKGLPLVIDTIKTISNAIVSGAAEGVASAIIKNGGKL